jgi:hypothetical protein
MNRKQKLTPYRRVEAKFRRYLTKLVRKGRGRVTRSVVRYGLILVLRLRQAVLHPFLLENLMKEEFTTEDTTWLIQELKKIQTRTPFIDQIGRWCEEQLQVQKGKPGNRENRLNEGLDARFDMIPQLERVEKHNNWQDNWKGHTQDLCRRCGFVPDDPFQPKVCLFC